MREMKRIIAIVLLIACVFALSGCWNTPAKNIQRSFDNLDPASVQEYRDMFGGIQADIAGDSYCKNCKKYIEGKVRICTYCGQYI